ncbi:MAG: ribosome assembly cofactor RimP [Bacteroidales bacterium]|nr:ribosome assembly cofactor RimP [Bacteroidales bacterium]
MAIAKEKIESLVAKFTEGTDMFLVSLSISSANVIMVEIDADSSVDIDTCVNLSQFIESNLDRNVEDFELTVSSVSLSEPFKVRRQYLKNIGKMVTVTTAARKYQGELLAVGDESVTVKHIDVVKVPPKNKKKEMEFTTGIPFADIQKTECVILFKNKII